VRTFFWFVLGFLTDQLSVKIFNMHQVGVSTTAEMEMTIPKNQVPIKFQIPILKIQTHNTFGHGDRAFPIVRLGLGA
jgi:hypothetical protein